MQQRDGGPLSSAPDSAGARPTTSARPAYRLFPSVESKPSATSALQKHAAPNEEPQRRRSASLDDSSRINVVKDGVDGERAGQLAARRAQNGSTMQLKPLATVKESPPDSPTVPARYTPRSALLPSDEGRHGRSSSVPVHAALGEQDKRAKFQQVWSNKAAAGSSQSLNALKITLPEERKRVVAQRGPRRRPSAQQHIDTDDESPPPPPPKSPRHHSRDSSAASNASTASTAQQHSRDANTRFRQPRRDRDQSPVSVAQSMSYTTAKPTFRHISKVSQSTPSRTPPTVLESRESYFGVPPAGKETSQPEPGRDNILRSKKPAPLQPPSERTDQSTQPFLLPASKFGERPGSSDSAFGDGEQTPKAIPPQNYNENQKDERDASMQLSVKDDVPPPTPDKDSVCEGSRQNPREIQGRRLSVDSVVQPPAPLNISRRAASKGSALKDMPDLATSKQSPPMRSKSPQPPTKDGQATGKFPTVETPSDGASAEPDSQGKNVVDRPTPELPFRAGTPDPLAETAIDPKQMLRDLAKQTEALHARYATLRSDRQKLSTSIVAGLRDQKAGPEYCNFLLDQHLSLSAINSSMDICFAKLKSLDCRKEEALATILAKRDAAPTQGNAQKPQRNLSLVRSAFRSGSPNQEQSDEKPKAFRRTLSKLKKDVSHLQDATKREPPTSSPAKQHESLGTSHDSQKGPNTIRHASTTLRAQTFLDDAGDDSDICLTAEDDESQSKRIRIKGAKAAKILGLMREAAEVEVPGEQRITLPDEMNSARRLTPSPSIEVQIPSSRLSVLPAYCVAPRPAPSGPLPPTPPSRKDSPVQAKPEQMIAPALTIPSPASTQTARPSSPSAASARSSSPQSFHDAYSRKGSSAEASIPEEPQPDTPSDDQPMKDPATDKPLPPISPAQDDDELPMGLKSARRGQMQTIQVFFDDEILDYYHNTGRDSKAD
ncbi:hypothetical protein KC340_g15560 [Hortaea werneckii]|nr:hypothetical protein KC342_g15088 [Hortaea werneckii]KAI7065242.1 hypothetical protein KC339_g15836 [Hortaea werneckii]KAI7214656.1 hypothetical protein KC365_g13853 [Hortaea werneckii]KAI7295997.1 hypothetical protein KC340_g15560 [Hortaea werneckii]KAI7385557.1 hypothetical protein KC328_g10276 [Hortaea werneckii]